MLTRDQEQFKINYGEMFNYFNKSEMGIINNIYEDYKELSLERDGYYKNDNLSVYTGIIEELLSLAINKFRYLNSLDTPTIIELKEIHERVSVYKNIIYKLILMCNAKGISIYKSIDIKFKDFTLSDSMIYNLFKKSYVKEYIKYEEEEMMDINYVDLYVDILFIIFVYSKYTDSKFKDIDKSSIEELINKITY